MFYWQLSVLWSQWHGHRPRVIRCIKPFHFISFSFHFTFSKVFFFFFYFFMVMCFSLFLFDVLLFWSSLRVSNFFVFPLFDKKSFLVLSLLFRSAFVLSLSVSSFFFSTFSLFTHFWIFFTQKTCHSFYVLLLLYSFFFLFLPTRLFSFFRCLQCFLVHVFVFFSVFFFKKKHCFDLLCFFLREK